MLQERMKLILEELDRKGIVKVVQLSKELNCSEVTIRSDIKKLEEQGLLQRTHGGAMKIGPEFNNRYSNDKVYINMEKKAAIARTAYEYIEDHDTIIIDDASTCLYLTKYIKEDPSKRIVVVTNSLLVAGELSSEPHVNLFLVGGQVASASCATLGDIAISNLNEFYVDKAFIGAHGINFNVGITSIGSLQMQTKRAIIKSSKEVYVLADSSKFGGSYLSLICPLSKIHMIITDNDVSKEDLDQASQADTMIHIAN